MSFSGSPGSTAQEPASTREPVGSRPLVAVVGGGITGLTAAHFLASSPHPPQVVLLEAADRLGGKILTTTFAGLPVETGPDTVLARVPWGRELCGRLGIDRDIVSPATGKAYVWARGRLRPLPPGLLLGVPGRLLPLARSGILSPPGLGRAALDLMLPASPPAGGDPTIAEAVGRRLGTEVAATLVEPLLAGINAGRADRLSLRAVAPDVAAAARHRSLVLGVRAHQRAHPPEPGRPLFLSFPGGLSRLVQCLETDARGRGVDVRTGVEVGRIERSVDGRYVLGGAPAGVEQRSGGRMAPVLDRPADAVVITVPAFAAARLLGALSPAAAHVLGAVAYASVAVVTLAYPETAVPGPLDASGFLVPRREGWLLTAATWISAKWPTLRPRGQVLLRASTGRAGDDRFADLDDEALVRRLHRELAWAMGLEGPPLEWRIDRWPRSFPQYEPGHLARLDALEAALAADAPGVVMAGAAWRGVGIASCIRQGQEAAERALALVAG